MKNVLTKKRHIKIASMILFLFLSTHLTFSQVTLSLKNGTLGNIIQTIKTQTEYKFFYDDELTKLKVGDINEKNIPVKELLNKVLPPIDVTYKIDAQIIYLYTKHKKEQTPVHKDNPQKKIIKGCVTDSSGEPLIGVSVSVKGTTFGTVTDIDGNYTLTVPSGYNDIQFSYVGFKTELHSISSDGNLNISLNEDAQAIDEVVVTALGIKREKKMLGYSIQELKGDELNKTGDPSVTGALQGKVAGIQMNISGTGLNGSTKITIRGNSSLTDNNQPLWVVDGVPFNDNSSSSASLYGGIDRGGASVDINPEDIESISVLKGPNAAALYGSRAGNGVILITTKSGTRKEGFGINYTGSFTWTHVSETLHRQQLYGQGIDDKYTQSTPYSFGAKLDGHEYVAWNGETMPYSNYTDTFDDYFNTGFSQSHNVSLGNVTDKSNYRLSIGSLNSNGLFQGENLKKINIDLKAGTTINKFLSLDSKVSLSKTKAENRPFNGKNGEIYQLLMLPANIRLTDLQKYYTADKMHVNWYGPQEDVLNPYYVNNQLSNLDDRWRAFGYYSMKINFTPWLHATAKYAFDYYRTKIEDTNRTNGTSEIVLQDRFNKGEENFFEQNAEFMIHGDNQLNPDFRLGYSIGGNIMYQSQEALMTSGQNMPIKDHWFLNYADKTLANQSFKEKAVRSIFATAQLSFKEYLSLDLTARNDWSTTVKDSYFYPSASLSFIISDFIKSTNYNVPSWLTFAKLRLSAAQVGKDTEPYTSLNYMGWTQSFEGPSIISDKTKANPDVKPEISTSYEIGIDARFFDNRLGLDFTWYHSMTKNQIMKVPTSGAWESKWINAGRILNKGIELMVYATPVKTKDFNFDLNINLSHNRSIVKELHESAKYMEFKGEDKLLVRVGAEEGGLLGDIYPIITYLKDANGNILVEDDGRPKKGYNKNREKIGNIQPDLLMSVTPTFSYKNIFLSALFDMKFGGDIVSVSEAIATYYGTAQRTEKRDNLIFPGVHDDGTPNTQAISARQYYQSIGGEQAVAEEFIYDASFIKLKEISLGYSFPKQILKKTPFTALKVSFVGRNLCYLLKHTPGTSPEGGFDTSMFSQAIDFTSVPYSRTLGFSVSVGF